ncbi:isoprenyl transferase [Emcibacter sp. SYSU 3D8]|uniref:isoprenyl transferase n=1 Tax=Emcibacter sp. SYSU 3D8 TaxID=3133969 RepID=UPI0031FE7C53
MLDVLPQQLPNVIPTHIAIIMDGNGRWAKARGLPRIAGHRQGAEAVRRSVESCRELGVSYLTLFAFSSENWKRPASEVDDLMGLLRLYLRREIAELAKNDVRLKIIGDRSKLSDDICALIQEGESRTKLNAGLTLTIAISYGAQAEIVNAARLIAAAHKRGDLDLDEIDEGMFSRFLYTESMPDPDLLIRTSGEQRLSNFMLWQSAYAELLFMDVYWPDFDKQSLMKAIDTFNARDRRFGATSGP